MGQFPEHLLRTIWEKQRFASSHLRTQVGQPITILSPGTFNSDGGPDFLNARVRIGNVTYRGDVELHTDAAEWKAHSHDTDPHYNKVILHVVMTADAIAPPTHTASDRPVPLLILHPYLDEHVRSAWMPSFSDEKSERVERIKCYGLNGDVPADLIARWINSLANERIELKVRRMEERLKQLVDESRLVIREPYPRYYGNPDEIPLPRKEYTQRDFAERQLWEQLLYEGIMEGMGYAKNREPFLALAQSVRLRTLRQYSLTDITTMMALLFGAGGLLPSTRAVKEKEGRSYLRPLRRTWKELRRSFKGPRLNEGDWLFFRLRPSNFPTARLAAVCLLLSLMFDESGFRRLIGVFKNETLSSRERVNVLHATFRIEPDEYWSRHYHFKGAAGKNGIRLGTARINEILVNSIVPTVLLYARIFKDQRVRANARSLLSFLPPLQENSITRLMETQLTRGKIEMSSASRQQGVIQLFKLYCSSGRCSECKIGQLVFATAAGK
jgi:hypothetical protein